MSLIRNAGDAQDLAPVQAQLVEGKRGWCSPFHRSSFWHLIRGEEIPDLVSAKKSIGHSHVLPPDSRPPDRAWPVLCKILHKACERLRSHGLLTGSLKIHLSYFRGVKWEPEIRLPETDCTLTLMQQLGKLWRDRPEPGTSLVQVAVTLTHLVEHGNYTPQLFPSVVQDDRQEGRTADDKLRRPDATLDQLRARFGRNGTCCLSTGARHRAVGLRAVRWRFR